MGATVKITITRTGPMVEVEGVADNSCHELTAGFIESLGTPEEVEEKPMLDVETVPNELYD